MSDSFQAYLFSSDCTSSKSPGNRISVSLIFIAFLGLFMLRSGAGRAAPEVKWSAQLSENNKFNFLKIIGSSGDGFFVLRSNMSLDDERDHTLFKSRKYLLQFFNSNLVMLWEKELKYTSPDVHIVAVYCINEKALIFSYTNDKLRRILSRMHNTSTTGEKRRRIRSCWMIWKPIISTRIINPV